MDICEAFKALNVNQDHLCHRQEDKTWNWSPQSWLIYQGDGSFELVFDIISWKLKQFWIPQDQSYKIRPLWAFLTAWGPSGTSGTRLDLWFASFQNHAKTGIFEKNQGEVVWLEFKKKLSVWKIMLKTGTFEKFQREVEWLKCEENKHSPRSQFRRVENIHRTSQSQ